MGIIYSGDRLFDPPRRGQLPQVPTPQSFHAFRRSCRQLFRRRPSGVLTIVMLGSTVRPCATTHSIGTFTIRSDVDLLMIVDDEHQAVAERFLRHVRQMAVFHRLVLEPLCITRSQAHTGEHRFGPSWERLFLRLSSQHIFGDHPLKHLWFPHKPEGIRTEMRGSILQKRDTLAQQHAVFRGCVEAGQFHAWGGFDSSWIRPMRLSPSLARRLLWWLWGDLQRDGTQEAEEQLLAEPRLAEFHPMVGQFRSINQVYWLLLMDALRGSVSEDVYLAVTQRLVGVAFVYGTDWIDRACHFVDEETARGSSTTSER